MMKQLFCFGMLLLVALCGCKPPEQGAAIIEDIKDIYGNQRFRTIRYDSRYPELNVIIDYKTQKEFVVVRVGQGVCKLQETDINPKPEKTEK